VKIFLQAAIPKRESPGPGLLLHLEFSSFTGHAGRGTNIAVGADEQSVDISRAGCGHELLKLKDGVHFFLVPFEIFDLIFENRQPCICKASARAETAMMVSAGCNQEADADDLLQDDLATFRNSGSR
jgi:hypothetical protein